MQVIRGNACDMSQLLSEMRALPHRRLTQIEVQGRPYFVKMVERHKSLRRRLFKGDPRIAFAREINLLQEFSKRGAAVAKIVAVDDARVALVDHGIQVQSLIINHQADEELMQKLGAALARLHALGLAHGRPSVRDICWNGADLTFLDLEAGAKLHARPRDQARDLYLMLHSLYFTDGVQSSLAEPALHAYRAQGSAQVWAETQALAARFEWVEFLSRPLAWAHHLRGKTRSEFAAIRPTLRLILSQ